MQLNFRLLTWEGDSFLEQCSQNLHTLPVLHCYTQAHQVQDSIDP